MAVLGAPVFPHGNLAFFVAFFSEMIRLSAGVGLRLHSIHPSITRESKWRYIMKKINLRELYPDVYTTDFFVDVTEEVMETISYLFSYGKIQKSIINIQKNLLNQNHMRYLQEILPVFI